MNYLIATLTTVPDFRVALKFASSLDESLLAFGCPIGKIRGCS